MLVDLKDRMHEVVMTAPSWDELQAIYMARNLYLPKNIQGFSRAQENEIYQRFAKGYNEMKDDPELRQLVDAITGYRQMLKLLNINDSQVALFKQNFFNQILLTIVSFIRMCISLVFVLPGNIMMFPLSVTVGFYAEQERLSALKSSSVKVKANDVLSSIKITAYLSTFPIYLIAFTLAIDFWMKWYFVTLSNVDRIFYDTVFFFGFPII